jgi:hypothetical protein
MNVRALAIYLGKTLRVGTLLQYEMPQAETITRVVADDAFARMRSAPVLSARFLAPSPEEQVAFWTRPAVGAPPPIGDGSAASVPSGDRFEHVHRA